MVYSQDMLDKFYKAACLAVTGSSHNSNRTWILMLNLHNSRIYTSDIAYYIRNYAFTIFQIPYGKHPYICAY